MLVKIKSLVYPRAGDVMERKIVQMVLMNRQIYVRISQHLVLVLWVYVHLLSFFLLWCMAHFLQTWVLKTIYHKCSDITPIQEKSTPYSCSPIASMCMKCVGIFWGAFLIGGQRVGHHHDLLLSPTVWWLGSEWTCLEVIFLKLCMWQTHKDNFSNMAFSLICWLSK